MSSSGLPGQSGVRAPSPDGKGLGPRSPTRRPTDRAVRGAGLWRRRPRRRPDPRRQRHAVVRDSAALSRRGDGGVLARAAHAEGAPGRAGCCPEMSAGGHSAAERTAPTAAARIAPRPMRDHAASRRKPDESRQQAQPDEPKRAAARRLAYLPSEPDAGGRTLHEPAATWLTNGPERPAHSLRRPPRCDPIPSRTHSSNRAVEGHLEATSLSR
jgi:hypothetical protein